MKIIHRGTPRTERKWVGTCYDCKSEIEAIESELNTHDDQRDGQWAEAQCPGVAI